MLCSSLSRPSLHFSCVIFKSAYDFCFSCIWQPAAPLVFLVLIGSIGLILLPLFMFIPHVDQAIYCFNVSTHEARRSYLQGRQLKWSERTPNGVPKLFLACLLAATNSLPSKQIFKQGGSPPLSLGLLKTHMSSGKAAELPALKGTVLVVCNLSICPNIKL